MKRGEIRWYTFRVPDKRRPVLVLTRDRVIDRLNEIMVVPATRTIRGLTTEVILTEDDGLPAACAGFLRIWVVSGPLPGSPANVAQRHYAGIPYSDRPLHRPQT